jgi:rfaE bifunctional protein nucleotidyltransferase chain/domain
LSIGEQMGRVVDLGTPADPQLARSKIRSLNELAVQAEMMRQRGERVVLAHGAFDLLHLGHVRYIEEARHQGDRLFVTVTSDAYVNKGPSRPVFSELLRAEMLGALGSVDWVAINDAPTAVNVIEKLKPDVYVKGIEYKDAANDVTGKIVDEQAAVESYGGRIHFTDDIVFSSSSLINQHIDFGNPKLRAYLDSARKRGFLNRLPALLERIENLRVLFVGETIIDEYAYVSPLGKPPKEFVLATAYRGHEVFAGGVVAAANHVANFCKDVQILTCFGGQNSYEDLVRNSLKSNVSLWAVHRSDAPTVRKLRYVEADFMRKLFEVYVMDDSRLSPVLEEQFEEEILRYAKEFDVVIVTDFGHGLLSPRLRNALLNSSRFIAVNAQSNSANQGFNLINKYPRANYVCIDAPEARLAVADKDADLVEIASNLIHSKINFDRLVLTHGRNGCVTFDRNQGTQQVPAFSNRIVDTMGAGDAFLAVTAPLAAVAEDMEMVGFIGNVVGSIKVGIVGHRHSVDKASVLKYIQTLLK